MFAGNGCSVFRPDFGRVRRMKTRFTYWQESDGRYLGCLQDYPDHWTQGESLEDLKEHLKDLFHTFGSEQIPGIRGVDALGRARRSVPSMHESAITLCGSFERKAKRG